MRILLLLNGPLNYQKGIEYGFLKLYEKGKIEALEYFYFDDYFYNVNRDVTSKIFEISLLFQPTLIVFFHVGNLSISESFIENLLSIQSKPKLVYDEGDIYGKLIKPMTKSMKLIQRKSHLISIRGLGPFYKLMSNYNSNIIYTPHSNSLNQITDNMNFNHDIRIKKLLFIGNKVNSKLGNLFRLPGAIEREKLVDILGSDLSDKSVIYGRHWKYSKNLIGPLAFEEQANICSKYWFHISYEHFPKVSYYFSDRLPIALACGQIYICHYHKGYDNIFKDTDFIYFFKTFDELNDIINYLFTLSEIELKVKSENALKWAKKNLNADVVWENFFNSVQIELI